MADDGFNGSVVDFASLTLGPLRSISFREGSARADVTGAGDTNKTYKAGIADPEVTIQFVGGLPAAGAEIGDAGALSITWQDTGVDGTIGNVEVVDRNTDGSMDGEIVSSIVLVPAPT